MMKVISFAALLTLGAALAIQQEPQPHCCILWTDENYTGRSVEVCRSKNLMRQLADATAYGFSGSGAYSEMDANMESFKCGSQVSIDFCHGDAKHSWELDP